MNRITNSIDFCRVTQIYFPLSSSFYEFNDFPADSERDCRRDKQVQNCVGEADTYGNYREAKVVNIKHHWWWKLNWIKQNLPLDRLLLLEEDHVVTADFVDIIEKMVTLIETKGEKKDNYLMTLGTYKSKYSQTANDWQQLVSAQVSLKTFC